MTLSFGLLLSVFLFLDVNVLLSFFVPVAQYMHGCTFLVGLLTITRYWVVFTQQTRSDISDYCHYFGHILIAACLTFRVSVDIGCVNDILTSRKIGES